jgi:hypothetical protein
MELFPHSPVLYSQSTYFGDRHVLTQVANQETGNEYGTVSTFASSIFTSGSKQSDKGYKLAYQNM